VPSAGKAELVFTSENGEVSRQTIHEFDGPGVIMGMHNTTNPSEALQGPALTMPLT